MSTVREALERATGGGRDELHAFYQTLLQSKVYVLNPATTDARFLTVLTEGRAVIPFFSEAELAEEWSPLSHHGPHHGEWYEFRALLWSVPDGVWLHLDPGQMAGKEFDPWEVALLRKGEEALEELLSEVAEGFQYDVEIQPEPSPFFSELKRRLRVVFEAYPFVDEVFLVESVSGEGASEGPSEGAREPAPGTPVVGLKLAQAKPEKLPQLLSEIALLVAEECGSGEHQVVIDLGDPNSPQWSLFRHTVPFYIVQRRAKGSFSERAREFWRRIRDNDRS